MRTAGHYNLLLFAQIVGVFGNGLAPIALSFGVLAAGGSVAELGVVLAAREAAAVAMSVLAGALVDRFPIRLTLTFTSSISALSQVATGVLVSADATPQIAPLVALAAVNGGMAAFSGPASFVVVSSISNLMTTEIRARQTLNARYRAASTAALLAGSTASGLLVATIGSNTVLYLDAATFAFCGVMFFAFGGGISKSRKATAPLPLSASIREGSKAVWSRPWVRRVILTSAVTNALSAGTISVLGPSIALESGFGPEWFGIILAAGGIGGIVGSLLASKVRSDRILRVSIIACAGESLPLLVFAFYPDPIFLALVSGIAGLGYGLFEVAWATALQLEYDDAVLARVWSWDQLVSGGVQPAWQLAVGPINGLAGVRLVLTSCAAVVALSVPFQLATRAVRDR